MGSDKEIPADALLVLPGPACESFGDVKSFASSVSFLRCTLPRPLWFLAMRSREGVQLPSEQSGAIRIDSS